MVLAEVFCTVELLIWLLVHPGKVCLPSRCTGMCFQLQCAVLFKKSLRVVDGEPAGGSRQAPFSITALLLAADRRLLFPCPPGDTRCLLWRDLLHKGKHGVGAAHPPVMELGVKAQLLTVS